MDLEFLLILYLMLTLGFSYPNGGPDSTCQTMLPLGHGVLPQSSPAPYKLNIRTSSFTPGETIPVVLKAGKNYFTGVYLQCHRLLCNPNQTLLPVGFFTTVTREFHTRHCFGRVHSTVTQANSRKKYQETVYWTAPVKPVGQIMFKATFVKNTTTFWTGVSSRILSDLGSISVPTECLKTIIKKSRKHHQTKDQDDHAAQSNGINTKFGDETFYQKAGQDRIPVYAKYVALISIYIRYQITIT